MINEKKKESYDAMQDDKKKASPINNGLLYNSTDIIKDYYLKMLGVVLRQSDEVNEKQQILFNRIVAGANVHFDAIEYLRMAKKVKVDDVSVFVEVCNDAPLKYRFLLDSMLLSLLSKDYKEQYKLIVEVCKIFNIKNNELEFLASLSKAICEMNLSLYVSTCSKKPVSIIDKVYYDYFLLMQSYLKDVDNMTIIQNFDFTEDLNEMKQICSIGGSIALIHLNLSYIAKNRSFVISNKKSVMISDCNIEGDNYPVIIGSCENVKIANTNFKNFKKRALLIERVESVLIENSVFIDCYNRCVVRYKAASECKRKEIGGVIYSQANNIGLMVLENCHFICCGTNNEKGAVIAPCITNIKCEVLNCVFENCFCQNSRGSDPKSKYMFTIDSSQYNCQFENSPSFNENVLVPTNNAIPRLIKDSFF